MSSFSPSRKIYIARSRIPDAGRGVFASANIHKDELIERCPVIILQEQEVPYARNTELLNYYFLWGKTHKKVAIALGFGSLYNHSYSPNAMYKKLFDEQYIDFIALDTIHKDEEITTNYNYGNPEDKSTLWIKSIRPAEGK